MLTQFNTNQLGNRIQQPCAQPQCLEERGPRAEPVAVCSEEAAEAQERKARVQAEIETNWTQVADMHKREAEKRTKGDELKHTIQQLNTQLAVGSGWSDEQEQMMKELQQRKAEIEARQVFVGGLPESCTNEMLLTCFKTIDANVIDAKVRLTLSFDWLF